MKRVQLILILALLLVTPILQAQKLNEVMKRQAMAHMQNGRYEEAIDLLNKYISENARQADGYNLRGLCFEKKEQYQFAVLDFRRAVRLDPSNPVHKKNLDRVWSIWRPILYKRIDGFKREIAIDPNNPFNYLEIGKSYRWLEEWKDAELWYDQYLARDDDASPDEIIRYTEILSHTGSIVKGEKILKKYVDRYPDDWRLWSRYGYFTMWLGNFQNAERAFTNALEIKPFFIEAKDGLDLARREGYLTLQSPRSFEREYPIDRFYRVIKNDPNDDESRFQLVEELLNAERFEEAYQQIQYLRTNYENDERFINLNQRIEEYRQGDFQTKIEGLTADLKNDPTNREAVMAIAQNYANMENYPEAEEILSEYLTLVPNDVETRFFYAKVLSYDRLFQDAYDQVNQVVEEDNTNNPEYKLLAGQLGVWLNKDLEAAEQNLLDVLDQDPDNLYALITLGSLNVQRNMSGSAEVYALRAAEVDAQNPDLITLQNLIQAEKARVKRDEILLKLEDARELVNEGRCDEAIPYFLNYMDSTDLPIDAAFKTELASIYICAEDYYSALDLYDQILDEDYSYESAKNRAKILYYMEDNTGAQNEFETLYAEDSTDQEVILFLGDVYSRNKEYDKALQMYEMIEDTAPEEWDIEQRIDWLPKEPTAFDHAFRWISDNMLSYMVLSPTAYYFVDDLDFEYLYYGASIETGLLPYISVGATFLRNHLRNSSIGIDFNLFKGNLFIRPTDNFILRGSYGRQYSPFIINQEYYEIGAQYEKKDHWGISANYLSSDAATILYSPSLVGIRLRANSFRLDGFYNPNEVLRFISYYQYITVDSYTDIYANPITTYAANKGNFFSIKVLRRFFEDLEFGYEFEFGDFKYSIPLYYTPQNYTAHSLIARWDIVKEEEWNWFVEGKLGYVPQSDYILRQLSSGLTWTPSRNFRMNLNGFLNSSFRENTGYNSASIYAIAFWSIW